MLGYLNVKKYAALFKEGTTRPRERALIEQRHAATEPSLQLRR